MSERLGAPLGTGRSWRNRLLLHHLPIALACTAVLVLFLGLALLDDSGGRGDSSRLTVATGYIATVLLGLTLLVGPANLLLGRRNPLSSYLRRDLGTWTVAFSVAHAILVFAPAHSGTFGFVDFFVADGRPLTDSFGLGNWTGLAALVIALGLLAVSTNASIRELKGERWKDLQRLNYTLFGLVVVHAILFGALARITSPAALILLVSVTAVLVGQAVGIWLWRRRSSTLGESLPRLHARPPFG